MRLGCYSIVGHVVAIRLNLELETILFEQRSQRADKQHPHKHHLKIKFALFDHSTVSVLSTAGMGTPVGKETLLVDRKPKEGLRRTLFPHNLVFF